MRYNKPRRNRFRNNDQDFRNNASKDLRNGGMQSNTNGFQRRSFNRNGIKAEKLLEQYNDLAKEALATGDKSLSESYYQHADHFLRVIESKNLSQNNSKQHSSNSPIEQNSEDKIIPEDKKTISTEEQQNS